MSKTGTLESLIVEVDPVAEYRARQQKSWRAYRTGAIFLAYFFLIGPFIVLWKPWDLKRRFAALRLKIHDALGTYFQPRETARALAMRRGDCNRCGACCQILYRCPYLKEVPGGFRCGIYEGRPDQCATFPHNPRSLELLSQMGASCSYAFASDAVPRIVDLLAKAA